MFFSSFVPCYSRIPNANSLNNCESKTYFISPKTGWNIWLISNLLKMILLSFKIYMSIPLFWLVFLFSEILLWIYDLVKMTNTKVCFKKSCHSFLNVQLCHEFHLPMHLIWTYSQILLQVLSLRKWLSSNFLLKEF